MSSQHQTEEDLYSDLDQEIYATASSSNNNNKRKTPLAPAPPQSTASKKKHPYSILTGEEYKDFFPKSHVSQLESKIRELTKENETLQRNIGTLYRTAKGELARKDRDILGLKEEIGSLTNVLKEEREKKEFDYDGLFEKR